MAAIGQELLGAGFDQQLLALLGETIRLWKSRRGSQRQRGPGLDRAQAALAQFVLRQQEQTRLARGRAHQVKPPRRIALLERGSSPTKPREQALGREFGIPGKLVPLAKALDPA